MNIVWNDGSTHLLRVLKQDENSVTNLGICNFLHMLNPQILAAV